MWLTPPSGAVGVHASLNASALVTFVRLLALDLEAGSPLARYEIRILETAAHGMAIDRRRSMISCAWAIIDLLERDAGMLCALLRDLGVPSCPVHISIARARTSDLIDQMQSLLLDGVRPMADLGFDCDDETDPLLWPVAIEQGESPT